VIHDINRKKDYYPTDNRDTRSLDPAIVFDSAEFNIRTTTDWFFRFRCLYIPDLKRPDEYEHTTFTHTNGTNTMNFLPEAATPALLEEINKWNQCLALLRGDNIYDVSRIYFSSKGFDQAMVGLRSDVPHAAKPEDHDKALIAQIDSALLKPIGLRYIRTLMGRLIVNETQILGALVIPDSSATKSSMDLIAVPALAEYIEKGFNELANSKPTAFLTRLRLTAQGELTQVVETIPPVKEYSDITRFYPYMNKSPAQVWAEFAASNANVMLLIGPPGTGKSNFILQMMEARGWDEKIHLADREDVLLHQGLSDYIRDCQAGSVMITEDSDKLVMKRTEGNSAMSALLNTTAGIVSRDVKIIISTNLPTIASVDEALVRPGRCFDILKFGTMTYEQGNDVRAMMGLELAEFATNDVTLAEVINFRPEPIQNKKAAFGFAS
jgi:hypothetical protein